MNLVIKRSILKIIYNSIPLIFPVFFLQFDVLYGNVYFRYVVIISALLGLYQILFRLLRRKVLEFENGNIILFRFFNRKTLKSFEIKSFTKRNFGRSYFLFKNGNKIYINVSDLIEDDIDLISNHFSKKN